MSAAPAPTWSVLTHDDLPPTPGKRPILPAGRFAHGHMRPLPPVARIEAKRIARQGAVAAAIRSAAREVAGKRRQMLADRALLIEVARSVDEVLLLLQEVEALGVNVERQP